MQMNKSAGALIVLALCTPSTSRQMNLAKDALILSQ
jgi:hypothetical protein